MFGKLSTVCKYVGGLYLGYKAYELSRLTFLQFSHPDVIPSERTSATWAVITGATTRLGRAYVHELLTKDYCLLLIDTDADSLQRLQSELHALDPFFRVFIFPTGSTTTERIIQWYNESVTMITIGGEEIGVLINILPEIHSNPLPLEMCPIPYLTDATHIKHRTMLLTTLVFKTMKAQNHGSIITVCDAKYELPSPFYVLNAGNQQFMKRCLENIRLECKYDYPNLTFSTHVAFTMTVTELKTYAQNAVQKIGLEGVFIPFLGHVMRYYILTQFPTGNLDEIILAYQDQVDEIILAYRDVNQ